MSQKDDLERIIASKKRRLQKLKEREAKEGIEVPPQVLIEIEDLEAELEKLEHQLRRLECGRNKQPQGVDETSSDLKRGVGSSLWSLLKGWDSGRKYILATWRERTARYKPLAILSVVFVIGLAVGFYLYFRDEASTCAIERQCFQVYTDKNAANNHFFPSGFMGDIKNVTFEETTEEVHSGTTAIKVSYMHSDDDPGWAGIVWQFPANNWGTLKDGFDLRGYRYVTFWAKGIAPNQLVRFEVGGLGRKPGTCERDPKYPYPESLCPPVTVECKLTDFWFRYAIAIPENRELHRVINGFSWSASNTVTFYLDDIFWVADPASPPWDAPLVCQSVP